ncbi:uncharacterized protein LOC110893425 [Helianthus annuus]|uniref:uncharacterized protein LOC110893425 n=1 Tax=Helianthus annuus TaxID=4232 RepID=UPI000B8FEA99|nr:uncharacterized protein LOC110893425 [Helianthus annuus]
MSSVVKHRYFLCIRGKLKDSGKEITVINVYAPQKLVDKRILWADLERLIVNDDSYWIVGGDFNCVRDRGERRNSKFIASVSSEFYEFIDKVRLHEFNLHGRKFTFVSGNKCSRIDRILVSWRFLNDWTNAEYRALAREKSDHSPLVLKAVTNVVKEFDGTGPPDLILMNKFWKVRQALVEWRKKVVADDNELEANLKQDLLELDAMIEDRDLTEVEQWVHVEATKKLKVLEEVLGFLKNLFTEDLGARPSLDCYGIKQLDDEDAEALVKSFSEEEIKMAVFECGSDKALGPDGFNFRFVKRFWSLCNNRLISIRF